MQSPIPGGHVAWWTTTLALVVYAHNHYCDGQSGAGVTLQHSSGGAALEGVRVRGWTIGAISWGTGSTLRHADQLWPSANSRAARDDGPWWWDFDFVQDEIDYGTGRAYRICQNFFKQSNRSGPSVASVAVRTVPWPRGEGGAVRTGGCICWSMRPRARCAMAPNIRCSPVAPSLAERIGRAPCQLAAPP